MKSISIVILTCFIAATKAQTVGRETPQPMHNHSLQGNSKHSQGNPSSNKKKADQPRTHLVPATQPPLSSNGRALPSPLTSPPFPDSDWLGFPLIGAPYSAAPDYPLEKALSGKRLLKQGILVYGWINPSFNFSSSSATNAPISYDLMPNRLELDQAVFVAEKQPNTVQTAHQDFGFRILGLYGDNYRYTTMKGVFSDALEKRNSLYGIDPVEMYGIWYTPKVAQGMVVRVGRYISPPDIEAQLTPENYLYSHSMMFTVDPYTFMGVNAMVRLSKQWEVMGQVDSGADVAPWSNSASLNFGVLARWASLDGNDGFWGGVNSIGAGKVRDEHDDLQQIVATWGHRFSSKLHMMTEAYYLWEYGANVGGTAIDGPPAFGSGGGAGPFLPGKSDATGFVNYFQVLVSPRSYISIRTDYLNDPRGFRTGFATAYTSNTIGYVQFLSPLITVRPEIRYDHAYGANAFNGGTSNSQWTIAADLIVRF